MKAFVWLSLAVGVVVAQRPGPSKVPQEYKAPLQWLGTSHQTAPLLSGGSPPRPELLPSGQLGDKRASFQTHLDQLNVRITAVHTSVSRWMQALFSARAGNEEALEQGPDIRALEKDARDAYSLLYNTYNSILDLYSADGLSVVAYRSRIGDVWMVFKPWFGFTEVTRIDDTLSETILADIKSATTKILDAVWELHPAYMGIILSQSDTENWPTPSVPSVAGASFAAAATQEDTAEGASGSAMTELGDVKGHAGGIAGPLDDSGDENYEPGWDSDGVPNSSPEPRAIWIDLDEQGSDSVPDASPEPRVLWVNLEEHESHSVDGLALGEAD